VRRLRPPRAGDRDHLQHLRHRSSRGECRRQPNQGDLDGTATGTLTLNDNGTSVGSTGFATLQITLANIDLTTLSGNHIHNAPATTTGAIVLDFGDPDTIRTNSVLSGTISGLSSATIDNVFANPTQFYYNIHNGAFPGGAVRSQLPEPGAVGMIALATLAALRRRKRIESLKD